MHTLCIVPDLPVHFLRQICVQSAARAGFDNSISVSAAVTNIIFIIVRHLCLIGRATLKEAYYDFKWVFDFGCE